MTARYAVASAVYGVPMVYMSQPLGVPYKVDFQNSWQNIKSIPSRGPLVLHAITPGRKPA